jgi:restriction endonuclease S subunit
MEGMDVSLLDYEKWRRLDGNVVHISEHPEDHERPPFIKQLKSYVKNFLVDKLATKSNVSTTKVPWSKIKAGDIVNWPSGVEFIELKKMKASELKRLHELAKANLLDFSPEFISRFNSVTGHSRGELQSYVAKYLAAKLGKKLKMSSIRIPWSDIKAEDIINWPSDLKFMSVHQMNTEQVKRIYSLAKQDDLDFSPEFINRFSSRKAIKVHELRSQVTKYLAAKLAKTLNVSSIKIPWSKMKAGDIVNWPPNLEFVPVYEMNLQAIEMLHTLAKDDQLDFSPEFLRLKNVNHRLKVK